MKIIQSVEKRKQKASALINALHLLMTLAIASCAAFTPQAIGFTINTGDILVGNDGNSTVIKIDPNTGQQTLLATFTTVTTNGTQYGGVHDLAFSPNGDLIVLQHEPTVSRVNLVTGAITNISSRGLLGTDAQGTVRFGLIVAPNGDVYLGTDGTNRIQKVSTAGAVSTVVSGGLLNVPRDVALEPSGTLLSFQTVSN